MSTTTNVKERRWRALLTRPRPSADSTSPTDQRSRHVTSAYANVLVIRPLNLGGIDAPAAGAVEGAKDKDTMLVTLTFHLDQLSYMAGHVINTTRKLEDPVPTRS